VLAPPLLPPLTLLSRFLSAWIPLSSLFPHFQIPSKPFVPSHTTPQYRMRSFVPFNLFPPPPFRSPYQARFPTFTPFSVIYRLSFAIPKLMPKMCPSPFLHPNSIPFPSQPVPPIDTTSSLQRVKLRASSPAHASQIRIPPRS